MAAKRKHTTSRRSWVERYLAQGRRSAWVIERACKRFSVSVPTIERDIAAIRQRWQEEAQAGRDEVRVELGAQIDHALASAYARGDGRGLSALLRLKAQFHGYLRDEDPPEALTPEDRALIEQVLAQRPASPPRPPPPEDPPEEPPEDG